MPALNTPLPRSSGGGWTAPHWGLFFSPHLYRARNLVELCGSGAAFIEPCLPSPADRPPSGSNRIPDQAQRLPAHGPVVDQQCRLALLIANGAASWGDGELALSGVTVQVKRLFDIGGFSDMFLIFATQAEWNPQAANVTNIASRP